MKNQLRLIQHLGIHCSCYDFFFFFLVASLKSSPHKYQFQFINTYSLLNPYLGSEAYKYNSLSLHPLYKVKTCPVY